MKIGRSWLLIFSLFLAACRPVADPTEALEIEQPQETPTEGSISQEETVLPTPVQPATQEPQTLMPDPDDLVDQWRPAIGNVILLGAIDIERAEFELSVEGDFAGFAQRGFVSGPVPSEPVATYIFQLEQQLGRMVEFLIPIEEEQIGSAEAIDSLGATCGALSDLQMAILNASVEAGLTWEDVDEIDADISPMIGDLYDSVMGE
jgi:hypothetical protein